MAKRSEIEKKLSEIKWCAQKLCELLELEPHIDRFLEVYSRIDASILHDRTIMNIEAKPPVIENESQA